MKISLSIKTLFRTPLKTLLTILLLASTSYMLFFSVAEYAAMSREMARAVDYYQGIGAVEAEPVLTYVPDGLGSISWMQEQTPVYSTDLYLYADERVEYNPYGEKIRQISYTGLNRADLDAIAKLPYVTDTSVRYMTAGVSESLYRANDRTDFNNYLSRFVAVGTLDNVGYYLKLDTLTPQPSSKGESSGQALTFLGLTAIAGNRQTLMTYNGIQNAEKYTLIYALEFSSDNEDGLVTNSGIHMGASFYNEIYSYHYLRSVVSGERYLIVARGENRRVPVLTDPATVNTYPQLYPLKGLPENYLELDEFAPLRELIEITNADAHTFDVVYTDDMSSIMRFAEGNMVISKGRMLTDADSDSNSRVCVMNDMYMAQNGLKVGDTITLKLGDKLFEQNASLGAIAYVRERYPDTYTEVELEIVGAYRDVDTVTQQAKNLHWSYSSSTVFVPQSLLPVEVPDDHVVKPGEFSFTIDDPRNISAFLAEARPIIEDKLGLTLMFTDGGWSALENQINRAISLALVRLLLLFFCTIVAIILTVYLFIGRKRKEYAIMRALGTTFRVSNRSLYIPLAVLAVFALAAGNIFGYAFIGDRIKNVLAPFAAAGIEADANIPGYLVPVCFVCVFAALSLATVYMLSRIGKKPPLELLQMGTNRITADARAAQAVTSAPVTVARTSVPVRKAPEETGVASTARRYGAVRHVGSYVARHIRRTKIKSLFSFGLALLLIGAIGQLTVIRGVYQDSYDNLDVKAYVSGAFTMRSAFFAAELDYVDNLYYENKITSLNCQEEPLDIVMTNDIARYSDGTGEINFLDGYDLSSFAKIDSLYGPKNEICVMESGMMQALGVKLGDTVRFHSPYIQGALIYASFGAQGGSGERWQMMVDYVDEQLSKLSVFFTIVGEAVGYKANTTFIPVTRAVTEVFAPDAVTVDYAEFTMVSPQYAEEFRKFADTRIDGAVGDLGSPLVMDTSEADNILRTLGLLNTLYPIVIAAAVIMSGLFPGLVVMQSDREASIMRVLGTTKKRTRIMLVTEQMALCILGQLCAAALLFAINGATVMEYLSALGIASAALLAGCIAGALICAVIITRRRILELLQVKE